MCRLNLVGPQPDTLTRPPVLHFSGDWEINFDNTSGSVTCNGGGGGGGGGDMSGSQWWLTGNPTPVIPVMVTLAWVPPVASMIYSLSPSSFTPRPDITQAPLG